MIHLGSRISTFVFNNVARIFQSDHHRDALTHERSDHCSTGRLHSQSSSVLPSRNSRGAPILQCTHVSPLNLEWLLAWVHRWACRIHGIYDSCLSESLLIMIRVFLFHVAHSPPDLRYIDRQSMLSRLESYPFIQFALGAIFRGDIWL